MTTRSMKSDKDLVEALAEIEHEQWLHWSQAVGPDVPDRIREKWQTCWVDYKQLTDDAKEADRVWARRVMSLLRRRKLI